MSIEELYTDAVELLKQLISIASYSKYEDGTAKAINEFLVAKGVYAERLINNVWAVNKHFDANKTSILLNSHHDTVKPNPQYTKDPFTPLVEDGKLYGLGSNDAGGCLVSLVAAFLHFYNQKDVKYNLVLAATAEEEISGANGIEALLNDEHFQKKMFSSAKTSPRVGAVAIVGEPTKMQLAVAEKGLLVLDCLSHGKAGHAARDEGENAIYNAIKDMEWFRTYTFPKVSEWLGPVKMSVTSVTTENKAHNMVPSTCGFVVDVRLTEVYSHEQVYEIIKKNVQCDLLPRSMRIKSTGIDVQHPLVQAGIGLGKPCYGSPTSSDKALMPFPALKCGPGDSARSHTADEFIYLLEIKEGIETYIAMLNTVILS